MPLESASLAAASERWRRAICRPYSHASSASLAACSSARAVAQCSDTSSLPNHDLSAGFIQLASTITCASSAGLNLARASENSEAAPAASFARSGGEAPSAHAFS